MWRWWSVVLCLLVPTLSFDILSHLASHGSHRYNRDVKQCEQVQSSSEIFEIVPGSLPTTGRGVVTVKAFTDDVKQSAPHRFAYGHLATVSNPKDTVSVYEPDHKGSCTAPNTLQRVLTYTSAQHNCIYAVNAGFFNVTTGNCLGNMYSDGELVVNANGIMNPSLGILTNGSIIVGYLTEEHVLNLDFINLVQGIIWLVRNGKSYVSESGMVECGQYQTTSDMAGFVSVVSARTAIGHDKDGNVLLLHVDGKTGSRGVNLYEFADLLIEHGFVNAINLDGGGSAHVVYNQTLINYPSDHCASDAAYRCERPISAVVCVHLPCECIHGVCVNHVCECNTGYTGYMCDAVLECTDNCTEHGLCTQDGCVCYHGYIGKSCHVTCPEGYYGQGCRKTCVCTHGTCDVVSGVCTCFSGWEGSTCTSPCSNSTWGEGCNNTCDCTEHGSCNTQTGECLCSIGWQGKICQIFRGGSKLAQNLSAREIGILVVMIGLITLCLISLSFNVFYCLKSKRKKHHHRSTRSGHSTRSPRLPTAQMSALEHQQRQIPIYQQIQAIKDKKTEVYQLSKQPNGDYSTQGRDVLELIEREMVQPDTSSDDNDTTLLIQPNPV